ncbi:LytTR family transcriptional regulator [Alteribacter lacisalsi]|uniref:LytTR family transcriptional regulator n=1 Tax=Alteribacter lacisalsi TaxID=2045244 RepID=A0A2W0H6K3_9BACI|nr:LytTR family DNA-binding domain-containing protein [Alteribacter lacisalsi]PYZ97503.1 LytTR family transcriptional regulator [Alteribacter lacisalsi]
MEIKVDIDRAHKETSVTIHAREWNSETEHLMKKLNGQAPAARMIGSSGEQSVIVNPEDVDYAVAEKRKVYAVTRDGRIELNRKLYEIESDFADHSFVRFSKSVVGNISRIERFEVSFSGSLCVHFRSGNKEYVSRRHVVSVKQKIEGGL